MQLWADLCDYWMLSDSEKYAVKDCLEERVGCQQPFDIDISPCKPHDVDSDLLVKLEPYHPQQKAVCVAVCQGDYVMAHSDYLRAVERELTETDPDSCDSGELSEEDTDDYW